MWSTTGYWHPFGVPAILTGMVEPPSQPDQSSPFRSSISGVFVGRQREMAELTAALGDAILGHGREVMLVGEPGIGKTRTAQEISAHAAAKGVRVLRGRCFEDIGSAPYWPWVQVIHSYVRDCVESRLRAEMGSNAAVIAEIAPDVREKLLDLKMLPTLDDPEQGRLRLFDAITTFLKRASHAQPLLLILDNLHWADRSSLLLLEFLAEELVDARILVLGTYRDTELSRGHQLYQTLGELTKLQQFQRLALGGLTEGDVADFLQLVTGVSPQRSLVREIHSRTGGNPLFVTEVVRLVEQQRVPGGKETLDNVGRDIGIPAGVEEAISRRLHRLSQDCNRVLSMAAVVGRQFGLTELTRLVDDISDERLLDAIDEASSAGIIEELPGAFERYQFAHVLIHETLTSHLSSTRQGRLHARIAQVLEELWQDDLDSHASELARHFGQAEVVLGPERVAKYSLAAGDKALAAYAYEDALAHFQRGLAAKERMPPHSASSGHASKSREDAVDAETAALSFGLGRAQGALEQVQEAWVNLGRAFDFYVESGDVSRAVTVAEYPLFYVSGLLEASRLTAQALKLVSPDSLEAGRLLCRYGLLLNLETADYEGAQEKLAQALAIARREGDEALELKAVANSADVHWYNLNWPEVVDDAEQAIALARRLDDPFSGVWPLYFAATALWVMGHVERASQYAADMLRQAERLRNRGLLANALLQCGNVNHIRGEWETAREFYARGMEVAPQLYMIPGFNAQLEYEVGEFDEAEAYVKTLLEIVRNAPPGPTGELSYYSMLPPFIARITGVATRFDITEEAAKTVLLSPSVTPMIASDVRVGLALKAVFESDAAGALEQYQVLQSSRGTMLPDLISGDRILGLLTWTMGDTDQAVVHFEDALAFCRKAGYRPELAWTCHDFAEMLLQGDVPDDRGRAISLVDEGLAVATELEMRPVLERLRSLQEQVGRRETPAVYPSGLTRREVEVLRLITVGKTNQGIAEELFISLSTVANHVTSILNKSGAANRAEATAFAARHGLV